MFKRIIQLGLFSLLLLTSTVDAKNYADLVNPYMGNISHILVPTYPMVHLPNSMLRITPQRGDYTSDKIYGLPLILSSHRGRSCFNISPVQLQDLNNLRSVYHLDWDNEVVKPYYYQVDVENGNTTIEFAPSHQSAIYKVSFSENAPSYLFLAAEHGEMHIDNNSCYGYQDLWNDTRAYVYVEFDKTPIQKGILKDGIIDSSISSANGNHPCAVMYFGDSSQEINVRYGVSFISVDQAKKNLQREIAHFNLNTVARQGEKIWNDELSKVKLKGGTVDDQVVFYTSLYRYLERPICISEDGQYFSASDKKIHDDNGVSFYTDDWLWDTYRSAHPLRVILDSSKEEDIINSFIRMSEQSSNPWFPTFPEVNGDSRRMNCNHGVAIVADAWFKNLRSFDLAKAFEYSEKAITEKTLAPWSSAKAGWLNNFYFTKGYIPALHPGEEETLPDVHGFEKRQAIPVSLGTAYDQWCLSLLAKELGDEEKHNLYLKNSYNYRILFNHDTGFFHPKDKDGEFILPFDYKFSGGIGARDYYAENNAWTYRWDVQHNISDLINLMGGTKEFESNLDQTFNECLGRNKYEFYAQLPDQTGNVGQFSMGNEPSLHIPYLYNYVGKPWKTQKRIRTLLNQWFRNDLMGVPGDEDGGGLSAFVVFSQIGFYPVTPGLPIYTFGSPVFKRTQIKLSNNKKLTIIAKNNSEDNKYIQSVKFNGKEWDKTWFTHDELLKGGVITIIMGDKPNHDWGNDLKKAPPSISMSFN